MNEKPEKTSRRSELFREKSSIDAHADSFVQEQAVPEPDEQPDHAARAQLRDTIVDGIFKSPHRFEFFQLLHLLERFTECERLGIDSSFHDENIRIRSSVNMRFPAAEIEQVERKKASLFGGEEVVVTTAFSGLYGIESPLPHYFLQILVNDHLEEDEQRGKEYLRSFLDIFNHRYLVLLYKCWRDTNFLYSYVQDGMDTLSFLIYRMMGLMPETFGEKDFRRFSCQLLHPALYSHPVRNADGLMTILDWHFPETPMSLNSFQPVEVELSEEGQLKLGQGRQALGIDTLLGSKIKEIQTRFMLEVGPVGYLEFRSFLPGEEIHEKLLDLMKSYVPTHYTFSLRIVLKGEEIPDLHLGDGADSLPLGYCSWLPSTNTQDVFFQLDEVGLLMT